MTTDERPFAVDPRKQAHLRASAIGAGYTEAPSAEDTVWQRRGLCRGGNTEIFYPEDDHEQQALKAIAICLNCPVMMRCRQWALDTHEEHGVWGGLSEGDRKAIWAGTKKKRPYRRKCRYRTLSLSTS